MSRIRRIEALEQRQDVTRNAVEVIDQDGGGQISSVQLVRPSGTSTRYEFNPSIDEAGYADWQRLMKLGSGKPYLAELWSAI